MDVLRLHVEAAPANRTPQGLCVDCQRLQIDSHSISTDTEIRVPFQLRDSYPTFEKLRASATAGCGFCQLLLPSMESHFKDWKGPFANDTKISLGEARYLKGRFFRPGTTENGLHTLRIDVWVEKHHDNMPELDDAVEFPVYKTDAHTASSALELQHRKPATAVLSERNLDLILSWLQQCDVTHTACTPGMNTTKTVPTRLISVDDPPRLIMSTSDNRYAALSHCWGKLSTEFTTTTVNLADRLEAINMEELPENFRDAIETTRKLRLNYVWIDALCIVQDDKADWEREAAKMGDVYRNAYVTISATSATCCTDGFLLPRVFKCVEMQWTWPPGDPNPSTGIIYIAYDPSFYDHNDIDQSVWNSRAWTFQERVLSRRTIHFSKRMVFFECVTDFETEDNDLASKALGRRQSFLLNEISLERLRIVRGEDTPQVVNWYTLVQWYSPRAITFLSDRLPALSGIAAEMSHILRDVYLAGLWKGDLIRGLLWEPRRGSKIVMPRTYRAPSWSWSSIEASVEWAYPGAVFEPRITIHDAHTTPVDLNPFGSVLNGEISMSGKIIAVTISRSHHNSYQWSLTHKGVVVGFATQSTEHELAESRKQYLALWVCIRYNSNSGGSRVGDYVGLILERTRENQKYVRRVGTFCLHKTQDPAIFTEAVEETITLI